MALQEGDKANFETLLKAAKKGHLALVQSKRVSDGSYVALLAAVYREHPGGEFIIVPLGEMAAGNPYELYEDPSKGEIYKRKQDWSPRG